MPLGSEILYVIDKFLKIIDGCIFLTLLAYIAYRYYYYYIYWGAIDMDAPFLGYIFLTSAFDSLRSAVLPGNCRRLDRLGHDFGRSDFPYVRTNWLPGDTTKIYA